MPNMAVQYQGPNPALITLTKELRARFGDPARTYEFVTGYKSPGNYSGHNPDNNGIVHAVDIFVGPGNLSEAQGMDVAERIRLEGQRGDTPGIPARVFYLIHNRRIAGGSEGWAWRPYTGADPHTDHIHVSTADTYWGDPVALHPSNYNTTAPWNLWVAVPLTSANPAPIQEDWFDMATKNDVKDALREIFAENGSGTAAAKKAGTRDWVLFNTREHAMAANNGAKANGIVLATIAAQTAAIKALAQSKPGLDATAVQASIDKAVQGALKDLTVTLSVDADQ